MSINLNKEREKIFNLVKTNLGFSNLFVGLGWGDSGHYVVDLDISAFMLGKDGKIPKDEFFIFYNNLTSPDGSLEHSGDNLSGIGHGDDEKIVIDLNKTDKEIKEIVFVVSIHNADIREHHFGLLSDAYIRIVDLNSNIELLRYELNEDFDKFTEIMFCKLFRSSNEWDLKAIGEGTTIGLRSYVDSYL
jgi:tellurium resistance protein TerD